MHKSGSAYKISLTIMDYFRRQLESRAQENFTGLRAEMLRAVRFRARVERGNAGATVD
jgi:hypothetical protein